MMNNDYLPIGSVVTIKDSTTLMMINGYFVKKNSEDPKVYDYLVSQYPMGIMLDQLYMVDKDNIDSVIFIGYKNADFTKYQPVLKAIRNSADGDGNVDEAVKEYISEQGD